MAITLVDGFDLYHATNLPVASKWSLLDQANVSLTAGRFGGRALRLGSTSSGVIKSITPTDTLSIGFAYRASNMPSGDGAMLIFRNATTDIFTFELFQNGTIKAQRGSSFGTVLGTSDPISPAAWHFLEFEFTRHASAGAVAIKRNGTYILNLTNQNTGSSIIDEFRLRGVANSSQADYDDLYVTNTATGLGECRVETLTPNADTGTKAWTPSTGGANYALVNEQPSNGDTNYVSSSTPGATDIYDVANLSASPVSIKAVQATIVARKDDVATRKVRTKLVSGVATRNGTTQGVSTSYAAFSDLYETDPATSASWTTSGVNGAQVGVEDMT